MAKKPTAPTAPPTNVAIPPMPQNIFGGGGMMGGGSSIQQAQDESPLFSDMDAETETTESQLDMRQVDTKEDWPFFCQMYHHEYKVVLSKSTDLIGRIDRQATILENLDDAGLVEKEDWWFDEDEQILYLRDSFYLLSWKMENCAQFEKSVEYVEQYV